MKGYVCARIQNLADECIEHLMRKENFERDSIVTEIYLNLRYEGTDTGIMCTPETSKVNAYELKHDEFEKVFFNRYKSEYGFTLNREIVIDDVRVRGVGKTDYLKNIINLSERKSGSLNTVGVRQVYFDGRYIETNLYKIEDMLINDKIKGPAIIIDKNR